jgi:hypothetical protein
MALKPKPGGAVLPSGIHLVRFTLLCPCWCLVSSLELVLSRTSTVPFVIPAGDSNGDLSFVCMDGEVHGTSTYRVPRTGLYLSTQALNTRYAWSEACLLSLRKVLISRQFDSNGVTGGCQAIYTVYPAANSTLGNPPICTNLTYPQSDQVLGVTALVNNGPLGQFAWIPQV